MHEPVPLSRQAREAGSTFVASALARVEVARASRTRVDSAPPRELAMGATDAFVGVAVAALTKSILESARVIGPPVLHPLDAIHLATAISAGASELWTYDQRMGRVAEELGIPTVVPG